MRTRIPPTDSSRSAAGRSAGFTLFEVTLTLLVIVLILGGVLALFNANSDLARVQTHVANLQQSIRVAQYEMVRHVRMTGRGPLPQGALPNGGALALANNVAANTHISSDDNDSPLVVEGTDVLTIPSLLETIQESADIAVRFEHGLGGFRSVQTICVARSIDQSEVKSNELRAFRNRKIEPFQYLVHARISWNRLVKASPIGGLHTIHSRLRPDKKERSRHDTLILSRYPDRLTFPPTWVFHRVPV